VTTIMSAILSSISLMAGSNRLSDLIFPFRFVGIILPVALMHMMTRSVGPLTRTSVSPSQSTVGVVCCPCVLCEVGTSLIFEMSVVNFGSSISIPSSSRPAASNKSVHVFVVSSISSD